MQARTYCAHCAEPVSLSETGTLQDAEGRSYCAKAPNEAPSHAPESKPQALRRLARDVRAEAEERKGREERERFSMGRRDARALEEQAEALEHEAAHFETRSHEASLADALSKLRGDVYEVEREDGAGYSGLGYSSLHRTERKLEELERVLQEDGSLFVFVSEHATGSDYGGSGSVGKANLRDLLEAAREDGLAEGLDYWELSGAHGSYGLALRFDVRSSELVRILEGLEDYPCTSDDTLSEVESEEESESWEAVYASDFSRKLEAEHGLDLSGVEDGALFELFRAACDKSNTYWEHSSEGASIDLERVSEAVSREDALALPGALRDSAELEAEAEALAQYGAAREALAQLEEQAESARARPMLRSALPETLEAARVALGATSSGAVEDCAAFLAQVARWPVSEHAPAESATPEELRAALALLRSHVGSVVRGAREELERFAPARFKRETERGDFRALPSETPKRD